MPKVYGSGKPKVEKNVWDKLREDNSGTPTVYFFSSESCHFCAAAYPYIESLEKKYEQFGVQVVQIDVDQNSELRDAANISQWPYYCYAEDGVIVGDALGWEDAFKKGLEERLGLTKSYQIEPGLSSEKEQDGVISGCGDSVSQAAEIAAGVQDAMEELEQRLKDHIDLAVGRIIRSVSGDQEAK
jgi:thiol-disulfide isomerase/thioredoxin